MTTRYHLAAKFLWGLHPITLSVAKIIQTEGSRTLYCQSCARNAQSNTRAAFFQIPFAEMVGKQRTQGENSQIEKWRKERDSNPR
jgi:hypothetical protein